jgi:hypothetical protein
MVAVKRLEPRRIINDQCAYSLLIMNWKSEGHAHENSGKEGKKKELLCWVSYWKNGILLIFFVHISISTLIHMFLRTLIYFPMLLSFSGRAYEGDSRRRSRCIEQPKKNPSRASKR